MKNKQSWKYPVDLVITGGHVRLLVCVLLLLFAMSFVSAPRAQLQQSGGIAITSALPAGTNQIGHVIDDSGSTTAVTGNVTVVQGTGSNLHVAVDSAPTTAVTGTFFQTTQPVSLASLPALGAGTNLVGYSRAQNACGTTNYESGMTNPPTSSTSLTATTTCVALIYVSNTTASAATITIQDQGTGCNSAACIWVDAFSVPPNSNMALPLYGMKFASGIKWIQGTSNALSVDILGNQ